MKNVRGDFPEEFNFRVIGSGGYRPKFCRGWKQNTPLSIVPMFFRLVDPKWRVVKGRLVLHKTEQAIIQDIKSWRERGDSLRTIAAALESKKVQTKNGGRWQAATVMKILKAELNEAAMN